MVTGPGWKIRRLTEEVVVAGCEDAEPLVTEDVVCWV